MSARAHAAGDVGETELRGGRSPVRRTPSPATPSPATFRVGVGPAWSTSGSPSAERQDFSFADLDHFSGPRVFQKNIDVVPFFEESPNISIGVFPRSSEQDLRFPPFSRSSQVLPTETFSREFCSSRHWQRCDAYPLIVFILFLVSPLVRSRHFRSSYRLDFLGCLAQTAAAPFYRVTFAANLLGDVLTSFSRPLKDLEYSLCYAIHVASKRNWPEEVKTCYAVTK